MPSGWVLLEAVRRRRELHRIGHDARRSQP
jgi:hypothetical protein